MSEENQTLSMQTIIKMLVSFLQYLDVYIYLPVLEDQRCTWYDPFSVFLALDFEKLKEKKALFLHTLEIQYMLYITNGRVIQDVDQYWNHCCSGLKKIDDFFFFNAYKWWHAPYLFDLAFNSMG